MNHRNVLIIRLVVDRSARAARFLSDALSPGVSVFAICVVCGIATWSLGGLLWGVALGVFCAVIPMMVIAVAVRRGRLTDRHVTRREQRGGVFVLCAASVLCGLAAALLFSAPAVLVWALLTMISGLVLTAAITFAGLKVSMHAFCMTALILVAGTLLSPWWLLSMVVLLPLIAFARLRLDHHTPRELLIGAALAAFVIPVAALFLPST